MATTARIGFWSRWALVGAIVLMGCVLATTVWVTYSAVRDAAVTVTRGEADALSGAIRTALVEVGSPPTADDLAAIVEQHRDDGLRYLATVKRNRVIELEAGTSIDDRAALEKTLATMSSRKLISVGSRARVLYRVRGRRAPRRTKDARRQRRSLLIEFEPREAPALRSAAQQTLGVGGATAGALLLVALWLVRWFVRQDARAREQERERRLASLGQMSAVLAHEIRNPLASLKGNAQVLERMLDKDDDAARTKVRRKAELVVGEASRLEQLTNDLLDFARAGELRPTSVDPAALLREAAADVSSDSIELDVSNAPRTWRLDGDRMRQVLTNLLHNATQAGDSVHASVARAGGVVVFSVRDNGEGISAEHLPQIFEPFFTRRTQGTGLGLAVAKRLVDLHGGTISVANAASGGAEFRVEIPK